LDRVRRHYQDGRLEPDDWGEQREQLQGELDGAAAEHERLVEQRARLADELDALDADSEFLERLSALRALIVGEVRDGQGTPDACRASLRRTFERFDLTAISADGRRLALGVGKPDPALVTVDAPLPVEVDDGDWSYALVPIVRCDVVEDWVSRDGAFPAVQRAALRDDPNVEGSSGRPRGARCWTRPRGSPRTAMGPASTGRDHRPVRPRTKVEDAATQSTLIEPNDDTDGTPGPSITERVALAGC
jgi:hypothetical protein